MRFTGSVHDETVPVPAQDVGVGILSLDLVISTGNDNLVGGGNAGDNCDVTLNLAPSSGGGPPAPISLTNVNQGQTWDGWSKNTVSVPIPAGGLHGGDITSVNLHTGFGGGDNWNVQRVQLMATIDPASLLKATITEPTASVYSHDASVVLQFGAMDTGGPGLATVVASLDGSATIAGSPISSGQTLFFLTELSLGTHTFTVVATDAWGNSASKTVSFSVIVTSSSIENDVPQLVADGDIAANLERSLLAKLDAAAAAIARGDCLTAANIYQAFINEVQAQEGKKISTTAAQILIDDAQYLINEAQSCGCACLQ